MQQQNNGFTLIELMVTVVIMAILVGISLPTYNRYVLHANRSEAIALLNEAAAREERYYAQNNAYTATITALSLRNTSGLSDNGFYQLSISTSDDSQGGYLLTATPQRTQVKDTDCATMKLNALGEKTVTGATTDSTACWK